MHKLYLSNRDISIFMHDGLVNKIQQDCNQYGYMLGQFIDTSKIRHQLNNVRKHIKSNAVFGRKIT